jgi:putative flavoprotein involved in K+ transport
MTTIDTVVVGAGHAGLAVSRLLSDAGREHVVLERGRLGERWRSERWDSLHLLTPAWMTRLPGHRYRGSQGRFMSAGEFVDFLAGYAESFDAPVAEGVTVHEVTHSGENFRVATDSGTFTSRHVVVASGPHGRPVTPSGVDPSRVLPSSHYRNPGALPDGGVLVVGASSSGVQIADELNRAGREVTIAVGRHTRIPRRYRGMDVFWWLETTGKLARTIDEVRDVTAARREPSLQLIGRNRPEDDGNLDLLALQRRGVRLAGHLTALDDTAAQFADDLAEQTNDADARMRRVLGTFDEYAAWAGLDAELLPVHRPPAAPPVSTPRRLDMRAERIGTVITAAGFRPDHSWLRIPGVRDAHGALRQYRGVTQVPGLFVVGQRFQHRRDSGFIDGARHDARFVVEHLLGRFAGGTSSPQPAEQRRQS